MIRRVAVLFLVAILRAAAAEPQSPIDVYFSPGRFMGTAAVVREIGNARQTIHLQAYSGLVPFERSERSLRTGPAAQDCGL